MDIDAGDSPWGGRRARSTSPKFQKLTNKTCHLNQKPARKCNPQTRRLRVRILPSGCAYWPTDSSAEDRPSSSLQSSSQHPPSTPKPAASRKTPARKIGAQPTPLEPVDGSHDPLGPLGGDAPFPSATTAPEQAPPPPRKELAQNRNVRPSSSASQAS